MMTDLTFKSYKKKKLTSMVIQDIILHVIFYWTRVLGSATIFLINFEEDYRMELRSVETNDFFFMNVYNTFLFFIAVSATVDGNIYKYYLSIIIMFHNAILVIFVPFSPGPGVLASTGELIVISLVTFSFCLEGLVSLIIAYLRRNIFSFALFKKVGLNEKINNAFAVRKGLETLSAINIFTAVVLTLKMFTPIALDFSIIPALSLGYTFLTFIQQWFISIKFNEEIVWMRKTAIILSFTKLPLPVLMIIYRKNSFKQEPDFIASSFLYFLFADQILITFAVIYFLISDLNKFGSGLKKFFRIKTTSLNLSNTRKQNRP